MRISYLQFIAVSAFASTSGESGAADANAVCANIPSSLDMATRFASHIQSAGYLAQARSSLMPQEFYEALLSQLSPTLRMSSRLDEDQIDDILRGVRTTVAPVKLDIESTATTPDVLEIESTTIHADVLGFETRTIDADASDEENNAYAPEAASEGETTTVAPVPVDGEISEVTTPTEGEFSVVDDGESFRLRIFDSTDTIPGTPMSFSSLPSAARGHVVSFAPEFPSMLQPHIPAKDFIRTNALGDLKSVLDAISSCTSPDLYAALADSVNLALYFINSETSALSQCQFLSCRLWRELLNQLQMRVAVGFADRKWVSREALEQDLTSALYPLIEAASVGDRPGSEVKGLVFLAPLLIAVAPLVIDAGVKATCWCIGKWKASKTTTTTDTPTTTSTTTIDPSIEIRKEQRRVFFMSANTYLDEIARAVGSTSASAEAEFDSKIDSLRVLVADRLTKVTSVLARLGSFTTSGYDPSHAVALTFDVIRRMDAAQTIAHWSETQLLISSVVSEIRSDLFTFAINSGS